MINKNLVLFFLLSIWGCSSFSSFENDKRFFERETKKMEYEFSKIPEDISNKDWVKSALSHMVNVDQFMRKFSSVPIDNNYSKEEKKYFQQWYLEKFKLITMPPPPQRLRESLFI